MYHNLYSSTLIYTNVTVATGSLITNDDVCRPGTKHLVPVNLLRAQLSVFGFFSMTHDSLSKVFCLNSGFLEKVAIRAKNKISAPKTKMK